MFLLSSRDVRGLLFYVFDSGQTRKCFEGVGDMRRRSKGQDLLTFAMPELSYFIENK